MRYPEDCRTLVHLKKSEVGSNLPDMEDALYQVVEAAFEALAK